MAEIPILIDTVNPYDGETATVDTDIATYVTYDGMQPILDQYEPQLNAEPPYGMFLRTPTQRVLQVDSRAVMPYPVYVIDTDVDLSKTEVDDERRCITLIAC